MSYVCLLVLLQQQLSIGMESELNCGVCGNQYRSDNLPRLLTACGHTFCENCLDTLIIEDEDDNHQVVCPEDGTITYLDSPQVTQFPKNIALLKVIEGKKSTFKDESFELTKIHRKEDDSHCESEQEILNQIQSNKDSSREESREEEKKKVVKKEETSKKEEKDICLLHKKPLDIVCLSDMMRICQMCAIFGQHKGHDFKSIEQIEQQWDSFRENIMNVYASKEAIQKRIFNQENSANILEIFQVQKRKHQKEVSEHFRKLREALKRSEEAAQKNLELVNAKVQELVRSLLQLDPVIAQDYKQWEDRSFGLIIHTEECTLEEKLKNLYDYNNTRMIPQGQAILDKIQAQEKFIPAQIELIDKRISVQINPEVIEALNSYILIKQVPLQIPPPEMQPKPIVSFEESLLEGELAEPKTEIIYIPANSYQQYPTHENYANNRSYTSQGYQYTPEPEEYIPVTFPSVQPKPEVRTKTSSVPQVTPGKSRQGFFPILGETEKYERPPKKKLKLIKVPEKIQKILDQLYSDTLDLLDLTNAELGDGTILQICEFLRGSKVRSVKFIRNKLTDDAIPKMMPALENIVTINLSQNMLTEHALDYLIGYRAQMPNMKSIILSQNKIIERKHKGHIDRLRKLDLTVSV